MQVQHRILIKQARHEAAYRWYVMAWLSQQSLNLPCRRARAHHTDWRQGDG